MKKIILILILLSIPSMALAWDGYDYENGAYVEIQSGSLVREGNDIEIYDYNDGEYKDVEVIEVDDYGYSTEVEVYDYSTGEYRTLEMDD